MRQSRFQPWAEERAQLLARLDDLEVRMKLLEARVRALNADHRREGAAAEAAKASRQARRSRPRLRCPGCLLELPPGRKGEKCVWCGFRFDAVSGRAGASRPGAKRASGNPEPAG
ncbi:MAG: hypothetical protein HYZ28_12375 [Myxococcales bacterium]|nr:hypothetical protein [Myxococcales bacterium]